ncbi:isochorismatase family protein [Qipengyuania qiaonensis]|uniref:Isochorismatase family protein n=1 Tax=Qipengyuania qiaonensis TaxID=2867240 RepID=A0ABS7J964_9SPHN|nr:isochorismatase family protein [Qipengyuania qiaonensis]MBX7482414.1 isochorismatase family protein [Qipengyuania qiaonensis]
MAGEDLADNYAQAFAGRLEPGEAPALLLVDMVEAYIQPNSPLYCETAAAAVESAAQLLEAARNAGRPVIFTNVAYEPGGADGGLFYKKVPVLRLFERGSPLGAFPPALTPREGEWLVTKQYPSAFFATGLAERLHEADIDTLVITGFSTSGCVRASALDALQYGFAPFVARDACADRHAEPHEANLFDLQAKYAEVVGFEDARDLINRPFQRSATGSGMKNARTQ